jgi:hypothetical protein
VLGPNGSLYPWIAPFVLAMVTGTLVAIGDYVAGGIIGGVAVPVRWLHQVAIDRGETR